MTRNCSRSETLMPRAGLWVFFCAHAQMKPCCRIQIGSFGLHEHHQNLICVSLDWKSVATLGAMIANEKAFSPLSRVPARESTLIWSQATRFKDMTSSISDSGCVTLWSRLQFSISSSTRWERLNFIDPVGLFKHSTMSWSLLYSNPS